MRVSEKLKIKNLQLFDPSAVRPSVCRPSAVRRQKNNRSRWTLWESFFVQRFGKFSLGTPNKEIEGMF